MDTKILHSANIQKVRSHLRRMDIATKNTLSQRTMLSVATCGAILNEMLKSGEAIELSLDKPSGGRPARRFVYNYDFSKILLINITHNPIQTMYFELINSQGMKISSTSIEFSNITVDDIISYIKEYKQEVQNLRVIGLSIPAVVKDGVIYEGDIPSLKNQPLARRIKEETAIPAVLENDVNLAALCYFSSFKKEAPEVISYLYHPEGSYPGLGIVINGKIIHGKNNFAGEIKNLFVDMNKFDTFIHSYSDNLFCEIFMRELHAITSLLAPEHLVISGKFFSKNILDTIQNQMSSNPLKEQYPKLIIDRDMNRSIVLGIQQISLLHLDTLLKEIYHD